MLRKIANLFKKSRHHLSGQERSQSNQQANASLNEADLQWKSLDITRLNMTGTHLRSIEASMAEKSRAEFAAVTKALNASQKAKRSEIEVTQE